MIRRTKKVTNQELTAITTDNYRRFDMIMNLSDSLEDSRYDVCYEAQEEYENYKSGDSSNNMEDSLELNHYIIHRLNVYDKEQLAVEWEIKLKPLSNCASIKNEGSRNSYYDDFQLISVIKDFCNKESQKIVLPKLIDSLDQINFNVSSIEDGMSEIDLIFLNKLTFSYYFE